MGTRIFRDTSTLNLDPKNSASRLSALIAKGPADFQLLLVVIIFVVFGLLMVFSASWDYSLIWYDDAMYQFYRQVLWMAIGIIGATVISFLDYHTWRTFSIGAMIFTIIMLILVLFGKQTGRTVFQGSIQPSELAKVVSVIYLSVWMHSKRDQIHDIQWGIIPLGVIIGFICGLIFLQPDNSAALTVFMLGGLIFFLGGGDMKQIITLLILAIIVIAVMVNVSSTGQSRILEFINGLQDLTKASDHVTFSYRAIINGGWFGVGIGLATTKLIGLPFAPTDSIFAVIAEELGLVGAAFTVALYGILVWRGIRIAFKAPDMLGSLLAGGLTLWIGAEALINILVMVGLLPFAGNALPFISYGGSSLLSTFLAIGILQSVARQIQPQTQNEEWRSLGASIDLRGRNRRRSLSRTSRP